MGADSSAQRRTSGVIEETAEGVKKWEGRLYEALQGENPPPLELPSSPGSTSQPRTVSIVVVEFTIPEEMEGREAVL